jgi:hypothetical protein
LQRSGSTSISKGKNKINSPELGGKRSKEKAKKRTKIYIYIYKLQSMLLTVERKILRWKIIISLGKQKKRKQ